MSGEVQDNKLKIYLDKDVYEMAKERIRHTISIFDNVIVAFSGGKDSLTVLNLMQEVYDEMGIKEKVKVFFRDEEIIPDSVIDFVKEIYESGKYDFRYYAIPLESQKYILGKTYAYTQWDRNRKWLREPPEYAIRGGDKYRIYSQYDADEFICKDLKGKVAIVNGIRADESLIRLRSCVNKKDENYINATKSKRIMLVKPIYDWTQRDVFVYFCKKDIRYCPVYDAEMLNGMNLRVSTPLHAESAKRFYKYKTLYPKYYQQIIDLFPEMLEQTRYYSSLAKDNGDKYEKSINGIYQFIEDNLKGEEKEKALVRVKECLRMRRNNMARGQTENYGGYPYKHIFDNIRSGAFKRVIQPKKTITEADKEWEND